MSVNSYKPHVLVLPEDDANRQIANGFLLAPYLKIRNIQILPPAGGWLVLLEKFDNIYRADMSRFPGRSMVLLIDTDERPERLDEVREKIAISLRSRIFVLGALSEPEKLKPELGSFETIGKALAEDCYHQTTTTWSHELLRHNSAELARMMPLIRPILF